MSKKPIIINENNVETLNRVLLNSKTFQEDWLQNLLENNPDLLPTAEIDQIFSPLVFIAREVNVKSGFIDNLYISSKGYLVVVETKLWRNPESRREVVGQIIDYAKDLKEWSYEELDNLYKEYNNTSSSLFKEMIKHSYQKAEDESIFIDIVEKNIKNARFLLMIVGDGIREGVKGMVEFLNSTPNMQYRFALCELEVYELKDNSRLVIPRITTKTKIIERGIIRIDKEDNIKDIVMFEKENIEKEIKTYNKSDYLTLEEWLAKSTLREKESEFRMLLEDTIDLSLNYSIGTADLNIYYTDKETNQRLKIFALGYSGEKVAFQPLRFYNFVDKYNHSSKLVDELLENFKKYLSKEQKNTPFERVEGYYYIDLNTILEKKEEILSIIERFISYF